MGRFSDKFKAAAKALALRSEESYESTDNKLGINSCTLRNRVLEESPVFMYENVKNMYRNPIELIDDIHILKTDLAARDKEIKFLKKVTLYFAQIQKIGS